MSKIIGKGSRRRVDFVGLGALEGWLNEFTQQNNPPQPVQVGGLESWRRELLADGNSPAWVETVVNASIEAERQRVQRENPSLTGGEILLITMSHLNQ